MATTQLPDYVARSTRLLDRRRSEEGECRLLRAVATQARRSRADGYKGRAWMNGHEVDGTDRRHAHMTRSYD
jgi:hypothetical protein